MSFGCEQCFCSIQSVLLGFDEVLKLCSVRLLSDIWKPGILTSLKGWGGAERGERKETVKGGKCHGRDTSFQLQRIY